MKKQKNVTAGFVILFILLQFIQSCGASNAELKISALEHFDRGNKYYKHDNLKAAVVEYKRAIALNPDQENFHYNLGLAYYSLVLYENAIDSYWDAIKLKSDFAEAWYNLALAFEKVDETEKAFMALEKYKKLNRKEKTMDLPQNKQKKETKSRN